MVCVISEAGTAYAFRDFPDFVGSCLVFCVMFCRYLFVFLSFGHYIAYPSSDHPFVIFKVFWGQFNVHCLLICSRPFKCQISPFNIQVIRLFTTGQYSHLTLQENRIGRVMVSVLALSSVDRGFEPWSGKTKDYQIGMCCFSAKHEALRRKSKDWLAQIQKNVSKWRDMSTRGLLFQWTSTIQIQLSVLVK